MKKIGKLGLTLAMVLAMAIGTTATAFAAIAPVGVTGNDPALTKKVEVKAEGLLDTEETFNFTLEYKGAEQLNGIATAAPDGLISNKKTVNVNVKQDTEEATKASGSITLTELFDGIEFSAPGDYKFELSENKGTNPNLSYSKEKYDIVVRIVWDVDDDKAPGTALKYSGMTVQSQTSGSEKTTNGDAVFENKANENVGTLEVTKQVAGNAANTNDSFTFKITLSGVSGEYATNQQGTTLTNGDNEVTIKAGDTLTVENLPANATWEVTETDKKGYDVTTDYTADEGEDGTFADGNGAKGVIAANDEDSVTFTNTKEVDPPTGVFMDILPYVLIAVVAAAACFFFAARRRREDY